MTILHRRSPRLADHRAGPPGQRRSRLTVAALLIMATVAVGITSAPSSASAASATTLYSNITGPPTVSGADSGSVGSYSRTNYQTAMPFVAATDGTPNLVSVWVQCVNIGCHTSDGRLELRSDNNSVPGSSSFGSSYFAATDTLGGSPTCIQMSGPQSLTAGTKYWAVMTSARDLLGWKAQTNTPSGAKESTDGGASWHTAYVDKQYSLKVEQGDTCAPAAAPNPTPGRTVGDMYAAPTGTAFNTIFVGNTGNASLVLTGGSFSGPDASSFRVLDGEPGPLAHSYSFPKPIAAAPGAGQILYVACIGSQPEGWRSATFTVSTNDPAAPTLAWPVACLVDATPPTIAYTQDPNGTNGWWTTTASLTVQGIDPGSQNMVKLISCTDENGPTLSAPASVLRATITGDGVHHLSCTATDVANNVATAVPITVSIDAHAPVIKATRSPIPNSGGWNKTDVDVSFLCADPAPSSGLASNDVGGGGTFTAETNGTDVPSTGSCIDVAGNTAASVSIPLKIDKTPPTMTASLSPSPNANGWYNSKVTVTFDCAPTGGVVPRIRSVFFSDETPTTGTSIAPSSGCADQAGNTGAPVSALVKLDKTAPTTQLTAGPSSPGSTAAFAFTASDALSGVDRFDCSLDNGAWTACASAATYQSLTGGDHTFSVRAVDLAGNVDATPDSKTWTVDATAPDTLLSSGPVDVTAADAATFAFSGASGAGTRVRSFECSLDGATFAPCISGVTLTDLAATPHSFAVRAVNAAGNVDPTPATWTWAIDHEAPQTTIRPGPNFDLNHPTFDFQAVDTGGSDVAGFECRLDGGPWAPCASGLTLTGLSRGIHTLAVRAHDEVGNTEDPPGFATWLSDLPPVADAGPDQTVASYADITLTASGSSDPDEEALTYSWVQIAGPPADLTNRDTDTATVKGLLGPATLTFRLTVTDSAGLTSVDYVTVTVSPK